MAQESVKHWYIVQTYSGFENKAKLALEERIRNAGVQDDFEEIYIPTETIVETKNGKRRERHRKFYNGYIFVKMNINDKSWHVVNDTPKVVGFLGSNQREPIPVPESEVKQITSLIEAGNLKASAAHKFEKGDKVRVAEGNFKDFLGVVEEVNEEKEKLRVFVEIFGRPTLVDLDFTAVAAVEE
ncbi:MAG: transcription termination/antitermination protein NusG [Bradymonadaceae bacterium]|nr:transcription termination/antitermination protein NusG [Lujinxingiaceae bacterium]